MASIDPQRSQFDAFKALPRDQPIEMLNLIRLRDQAVYPDDHALHGKAVSGLEAYRSYGRDSGPIFARVGGRQIWAGKPQAVVTGPLDEAWDLAFIAAYPNASAFLEMVTDPEYREAVKHRSAGVADFRLIRLSPLTAGATFGEAD